MRKLKKYREQAVISAETVFEVPFNDVDMMGIVWYGNYVKYIEMGRSVIAEKIGIDYCELEKYGFAAPVVSLRTCYRKSARYKDKITVAGYFVPTYSMLFRLVFFITDQTGQILAASELEQVLLKNGESVLIYSEEIDCVVPEHIRPYLGAQ